jgi:hypothetical protein
MREQEGCTSDWMGLGWWMLKWVCKAATVLGCSPNSWKPPADGGSEWDGAEAVPLLVWVCRRDKAGRACRKFHLRSGKLLVARVDAEKNEIEIADCGVICGRSLTLRAAAPPVALVSGRLFP